MTCLCCYSLYPITQESGIYTVFASYGSGVLDTVVSVRDAFTFCIWVVMRKYIIHSFTLLSYVASIYYLFVDFKIWFGIAAMVVLFILYHLSILDAPHLHVKYAGKVFLGIVMIGSAIAILLGYDWTTSVSLGLLHI